MNVTNNHLQFCEIMNGLNLTDIFNDPEFLNKLEKKLDTGKRCKRCGHKLYLSDVPSYDYVCVECDENFYGFEVDE